MTMKDGGRTGKKQGWKCKLKRAFTPREERKRVSAVEISK
jgi:hypothetical protein